MLQAGSEVVDGKRFKKALAELYGRDKKTLRNQLTRYRRILDAFKIHFPEGDVHWFSSPGRIELGGNHTDHNAGRVLAASIDLDSVAAAKKTTGAVITVHSEGFPAPFIVDTNDPAARSAERGTTAALIRGTAARFKELGYLVGGFDAQISSTVMVGSGLSSSASVEVLLGAILSALYNRGRVKPETLAMIGQHAENVYFGKPCGLMDQMTCAVGGVVAIDFKDARHPRVARVPFDFGGQGFRLVVVNTGGNHADLTDDYASVPREMKAVAAHFAKPVCREIDYPAICASVRDLREVVGDRAILRALHFLDENQRVARQVEALKKKRFPEFLRLVNESGDSSFKWLQNCYTTKNLREQGVSLALAFTRHYLDHKAQGACRVHGGGFAGTILVFLPDRHLDGYRKLMEAIFGIGSVLVLAVRPRGAVHINSMISG